MLKVSNIETWYDLIRALHGISFEVKQGDIIALLGSNGAGKTTTLKTIMRLLYNLKEEQPEKGTIEFLGTRIERKDTDQIVRMGISYVPEGREVFPELTVMENILMGAYTRKDKKGINDDIENVFHHFPILKERIKQEAGYMSGGEQQMLAIGMTLVVKPELLLLDEPLLGLSPMMQKTLVEAIVNLKRDSGITVLMSEQFARPVLPIIHRGYVIENGMLTLSGTGAELMDNPEIKAAYFGI
jgi:branched-chain amino acid transport system ATP-binding protein